MSTRSYTQKRRAKTTEATGERIVDSFLNRLLKHWYDEITLKEVAAEAGVTVQTLVRRFGGKGGLLKEAVAKLAGEINDQRVTSYEDPVVLVESLLDDYERTGDAVLRLLALEHRHEDLADLLDFGRSQHREWVVRTFPGPLDREALDILVVATDVYTWKLLCRDMGREREQYRDIVIGLIDRVLAEQGEETT